MKEPKKISLKEIEGVLSRDEMKQIMAGSGSCQGDGDQCSSTSHLNCCTGMECTDYKCGYPT